MTVEVTTRASSDGPPKPYGNVRYADPKNGKYPIDTEEHCRAAWSYINMPKNQTGYSDSELAAIKGRIKARMKELGMQVSEDRNTDDDDTEVPVGLTPWGAQLRTRSAELKDVNYAARIITVIAAPYDQPAIVEYRGQAWQEMFLRGAWDKLKNMPPTRVRANRDHDKTRTVGKVINLWPQREEGLVAEVRCAKTPLGDETLALADDECLSASVGFAVLPEGEQIDRATRTRRITSAYLDHLSFVPDPAYEGASVLGVRYRPPVSTDEQLKALAGLLEMIRGTQPSEHRATPNLDQFAGDDVFRWASERLRRST